MYEFDTEGKVTAVTYPGGNRYRNTFDQLARLNGVQEDLTGGGVQNWVQSVVYGVAGELKQMVYTEMNGASAGPVRTETRNYNTMLQLTSMTVSADPYIPNSGINLTYNYSATANNGKVSSMVNAVSGETVVYAYDALNRLSTANTTAGPSWGLSFNYDGFGNRLDQTVTQGSGPAMSLIYDGMTNRIATAGYGYDANGNMTAMPGKSMTFDYANRLKTVLLNSALADSYGYAPDNKRIYKRTPNGSGGWKEEIYFYVGSQKLLTVTPRMEILPGGDTPVLTAFDTLQTHLWFGSKKLSGRDRLGSDMTSQKRFYPYGEEQSSTANDADKFATYYRDQQSGFDYADQRYYVPGMGRFLTVDPGPHDSANPQSWNRYSYTWNDPVNLVDPDGRLPGRIVLDPGPGGPEDPRSGYIPNAAFFLSSWLRDYPPPADQPGFDPRDYYGSREDCFEAAGANLSEAQAGLLATYGKSWSQLGTAQQANFLNITAALKDASLSISGLVVTAIQNDRILFAGNSGFRAAVDVAAADGNFLNDFLLPLSPAHKGYKDQGGFRQNVANAPLQISFGAAGIDVDIDYWNGVRDVVGMFKHMFGEGVVNAITRNPTSPFAVARMLRARGINLGHDCN